MYIMLDAPKWIMVAKDEHLSFDMASSVHFPATLGSREVLFGDNLYWVRAETSI